MINVSQPLAKASATKNSNLRVLLPPGVKPSWSSRLIQILGPSSALVKFGAKSIGVGPWV